MAVRQRSGSIHLWGQLPFIRARADKRPAAAFPEIRSEGSRLLDWWRLDALLSLFSPVLLLIVWEVLTRSGLLNWRFFPAPTAIAETFIALLRSGVLLQDIASTLGRVAVGFFMGAVPGLILGLVMGLSRPVRTVLNPIARSVYPIPKIAIFPLILLIFGLGELSKYVAISTGVIFFLLFNTMTGVMSIEDIHLDVAKNYGASRFDLYRTVALPGALPDILVGIQQGIVAALLIVVTTEFVGGTDGVGALIWVAWQKFEVEKMYSGLLVMSLLGFVLQQLLELVAARVIPWKPGLYGLESKFRETNQMNAPILGRLGGISALLVSIVLAACGGGQAASSPSQPARSMAASTGSSTSAAHVRVALTNGSITGAGIYVALERGYFTQNGLDVEIVPFPGGAQMISSVAASQVEIADTDAGAGLLNAISRDLPMRFVADGSRCDQKHCGTAFVVRKELLDSGKFTDLKDLKGLTVNNFTPGSTLYQYLSRMLDKAGLKSTDLKVQNINAFTDVLAALSNGSVDASWMVEPLTTQGVEKGFLERYKNATELFGPQQNTLIVYSPEFATKQQDAGRRFMMAYVRGVRDYLDAMDAGKDYETVVSYLTKDSILKDPALYKKVGLPGFDQNAQLLLEPLKVNQQWYVDHGDVKNPVNMDQVYDPSYLQAAFDVLGTR